MSAKIYAVPTEFENVPNIFDHLEDQAKYNELIAQWYEGLKQWCKSRNPYEDQKYIGEIVKWGVADGYAEYMVSALEDEDGEVELLHLPVMDGYQYGDADLQTAKRIKDKIDGDKRFSKFWESQCNVGEVNAFLEEFGTEVYDMPDSDLELKMDNHICVKWRNPIDNRGEVEYFVAKDNSCYGKQGEKVYNYLHRQFHV